MTYSDSFTLTLKVDGKEDSVVCDLPRFVADYRNLPFQGFAMNWLEPAITQLFANLNRRER